MGIEPTSLAWKAKVLPLNYTRKKMVVGAGFEPAYSERTDLQSVAFNHSATPPIFLKSLTFAAHCNNAYNNSL